jgi:hypothetical protein
MFVTSLLAALASVATVRPQMRRRDSQPDPGGILDELFAVWPLDAEEERLVRARYAPS